MRRIVAAMGLVVLSVALAGWATLAWGQPGLSKLPPSEPEPALPDPSPSLPPAPSPSAPPSPVYPPSPAPPSPTPPSPTPPGPSMTPPAPTPTLTPTPAPVPTPAPSGVTPASARPTPPATQPGGRSAGEPGGEQPEVTVTNSNTTGRQEPAVSIEWIGPPTSKLNQPTDYSVVVRNACNIPVQQVLVRVKLPSGMTVNTTEPKAVTEANVIVWELGTLMPRQERVLQARIVCETKGDMMPQAWVTFTGSSVMRVLVREPKLVMKASAPERVLVGDAATFTLTVTNPGDGPAEQVKIHAALSDGLEHARGNKVDFEVGNLAPGESRSVQLICGTKAGGEQRCDAIAIADSNLKVEDRAAVNVIMPRLDLAFIGPGLRYLDRKATYTLKVTNPGDAPATNVMVSNMVPNGFKFVSASDGGRHDFSTRTVSWFLGEIGPGLTKEVKLEVVAINPGEFKQKALATAARGLKQEAELITRIEGLSALLLEVVDTEDPIEVGEETTYEIRVTNTGSKTETDIKVICFLPDKMDFKAAQGPTRFVPEGKTVVFEPLPKLAARADAIYRLTVKTTAAGDVRFKTQVTSTNLIEPVIEMEATRVYADAPERPGQ